MPATGGFARGGGSGGGGGGVSSLAKLGSAGIIGAVTLSEGAGISINQVSHDLEIAGAWHQVGTPARASDVTFRVTNNVANLANLIIGRPIRYRQTAGTWRYGVIVTVVNEGATLLITLRGAPMTAADDDELSYGNFSLLRQIDIVDPGQWADANDPTLLENDLLIKGGINWQEGTAYVIGFYMRVGTDDSGGADAKLNVVVGGANLLAAALNEAEAGVYSTTVQVANYVLGYGTAIELSATKGTTGDSKNLVCTMDIVRES